MLYFSALARPCVVEFPSINPWIFIKASQEQCLLVVMKNPKSFGFGPFAFLELWSIWSLASAHRLITGTFKLISLITKTILSHSKPSQFWQAWKTWGVIRGPFFHFDLGVQSQSVQPPVNSLIMLISGQVWTSCTLTDAMEWGEGMLTFMRSSMRTWCLYVIYDGLVRLGTLRLYKIVVYIERERCKDICWDTVWSDLGCDTWSHTCTHVRRYRFCGIWSVIKIVPKKRDRCCKHKFQFNTDSEKLFPGTKWHEMTRRMAYREINVCLQRRFRWHP